jgi:hypothetical protein
MGALRIGILIAGPYGTGYLWFHLNCGAKRQFERVAEAYAQEAWKNAKDVPENLPSLDELKQHVEAAEAKKKESRTLPYAELAPSARSKCKHCEEPIAEGSMRVVLARGITFGRQTRTTAIFVHPRCVAAELQAQDCETESEGLHESLRANSRDLPEATLAAMLDEVGPSREA